MESKSTANTTPERSDEDKLRRNQYSLWTLQVLAEAHRDERYGPMSAGSLIAQELRVSCA